MKQKLECNLLPPEDANSQLSPLTNCLSLRFHSNVESLSRGEGLQYPTLMPVMMECLTDNDEKLAACLLDKGL